MSRRRIWLIIIGILMAGVSATWEMEKFVSSHGVNTAAVVGFEASAIQPDAGSPENPYMAENWMKMAENAPESPSEAETTVTSTSGGRPPPSNAPHSDLDDSAYTQWHPATERRLRTTAAGADDCPAWKTPAHAYRGARLSRCGRRPAPRKRLHLRSA